ncbi:hypothetical protein ACFQ51_40080 [Streptomyces kaempferi]
MTVAVSTFAWPNTDGSGADANAVDVLALVTVWLMVLEVEVL